MVNLLEVRVKQQTYNSEYYRAHKQVIDGRRRARLLANPQYYQDYFRNYNKQRSVANSACMRFWRAAHPNYMSEYNRVHRDEKRVRYQNDPNWHARKRSSDTRYRERLCKWLALSPKLTVELIQQVYERNIKQHGTLTCYLCLRPIMFCQDNLEHKVPIARGGVHSLENMDVAHRWCNQSKGILTYEEFKQRR